MAGRTPTGSRKLQARILAALAVLVMVYAGFGWLVIDYGVPVPWVVLGAAAVLVAQWLPSERLALAVTKARLVDQHQAPRLHATLERLCALTGQPKPRVALTPDQAANAFTVGRSRRHTTIIVTRGLLRLDPPELEAALAHELAHIEHRDVAVMTLASATANELAWLLLGPFRLLRWLEGSEADELAKLLERAATEVGYGTTRNDFFQRLNPSVRTPHPLTLTLLLAWPVILIESLIITLWGPVLAGSALATYLPLRALRARASRAGWSMAGGSRDDHGTLALGHHPNSCPIAAGEARFARACQDGGHGQWEAR